MTATRTLQVTAPNDRDIVMTRVFNAPPALVFKAMTTPALVKQWLGVFGGWSLDVCEIDLRVGGIARYLWRNVDGTSMGMRQTYREIVPSERLVCTEAFDDPWYPGEAVSTVVFEDHGATTTMVNTVRYETKAIRDAVLQSPMEGGVSKSYDALDTVLAERAS